MAVFNFMFPIVAGKEDEARKFAFEATADHADDYTDLMRRSGTTRVSWTLTETPAGSFLLVWYEADDVQKIFELLATSRDDAATWMRERIEEVGGIELTGPPPMQLDVVLEWPAS